MEGEKPTPFNEEIPGYPALASPETSPKQERGSEAPRIQNSSTIVTTSSNLRTTFDKSMKDEHQALLAERAAVPLDMSVNQGFMFLFLFGISLTGLLIGYGMGYENQAADLINAKLGWYDDHELANRKQAYIGTSLMLGMTVGAVSGGRLMKIGRRKAILVSCIFGIAGVVTTYFLSFQNLIIGRLLYGFSTGLFSAMCPRFLEETVPNHLYDKFAPLYVISQTVGNLVAFMTGEMLPDNTDKQALIDDDINWLLIIVYFPLVLYASVIIFFVFILRHDAVKFLVTDEGKKEAAKQAIQQVYKHCGESSETQEKYYQKIKQTCADSSSGLNFKDALCNAQYRRSTWVNVGYIIFHELTGINVINLYSTTLFKEMHKGGGGIAPRTGTYIVGVFNLVGTTCSILFVNNFGRKTLLIWGHILIAIVHAMVGYFNVEGNNNGVVVMIMVFLFVYGNTSGPLAWLYAAETVIDVAMGICLLTLWGTVCVLSQVCPILMDENSIGPSNVFFIFSGLSVFGALYVAVFIKESRGLSDREKKLLYTPKRFITEADQTNSKGKEDQTQVFEGMPIVEEEDEVKVE